MLHVVHVSVDGVALAGVVVSRLVVDSLLVGKTDVIVVVNVFGVSSGNIMCRGLGIVSHCLALSLVI